MIKINKDYNTFFEFMSDNKEIIYNELFELYSKVNDEDVVLEVDVKSIDGIHYHSGIKYKKEDKFRVYTNILNFYQKKEYYDKCLIIKNLLDKMTYESEKK